MPYTPTNFLQAETKGYGLQGDILENALKGYEMARRPKQISQEEKYRDLANRLTQEQGTKAQIENYYLPRKSEADIGNTEAQTGLYGAQTEGYNIENALQREFGRAAKQADILGKQRTNEHQRLVNKIMEATGLDAAKADVYLKQQQAKFAHLNHLTAEQKNAQAAGYAPGSPEYQQIMKGGLGIFDPPKDSDGNPLPVPKNAISLMGKGMAERDHYAAEMRKNVEKGEAAKRANRELDKIITITKANPKLNRSFSYIASDPELSNPSTWQKAIKGLNEKEQTQLDLLVKATNKLVLAQEDAQSGRGSDMRRRLIQSSKPGVGMTDKARIEIAEATKQENAPLAAYADEAAPFIGSVYIPYQAKNYEKSNGYEGSESEMVTVRNKKTGKTETVTRKEAIARGAIK